MFVCGPASFYTGLHYGWLEKPLLQLQQIFTTRHHASMVYAIDMSVCLSQVGKLNVGSCKQRHTIAQGLTFSDAEDLSKTQTRSPQWKHQIQVGYVKIGDF